MKWTIWSYVGCIAFLIMSCEPNEPKKPQVQALPGIFSVSETKQVQFSQGNLQYNFSADSWMFATNQYDIVGEKLYQIPWTDIFGWSADQGVAQWGLSPTLDMNKDEFVGNFVDWGKTIGDGKTWYTLSKEEWKYVLMRRPNADQKKGVGSIRLSADSKQVVNGLILLPDNWVRPKGVYFKVGFSTQGDSSEEYGRYQTFSLEQWKKLEQAGAVFLPASGNAFGAFPDHVQDIGVYWSSTADDEDYAYSLTFRVDRTFIQPDYRFQYSSVRLVKDK